MKLGGKQRQASRLARDALSTTCGLRHTGYVWVKTEVNRQENKVKTETTCWLTVTEYHG